MGTTPPSAKSRARAPHVDSRGRQPPPSEAYDVDHLREELAKSQRAQHQAQTAVYALRSEFMHLVSVMTCASGPKGKLDLSSKLTGLDASAKSTRSQESG